MCPNGRSPVTCVKQFYDGVHTVAPPHRPPSQTADGRANVLFTRKPLDLYGDFPENCERIVRM